VTHTFTGGHNVALIVMDDGGALGTVILNVNQLPVVSFTTTCSGLTCTFDASASYDPDGRIAYFVWKFGDLTGRAGASTMTPHTYAAGGTYIVSVSATDLDWGTTTYSQAVTVKDDLHIGDLDASTTIRGNTWTATVTVTVHNTAHGAVPNAVVNGSWDDGVAVQCSTDATGHCLVVNRITSKNTTRMRFTVTDVALVMFAYRPAANHDDEGDSNGTTISVTR
jgi:PKD domain